MASTPSRSWFQPSATPRAMAKIASRQCWWKVCTDWSDICESRGVFFATASALFPLLQVAVFGFSCRILPSATRWMQTFAEREWETEARDGPTLRRNWVSCFRLYRSWEPLMCRSHLDCFNGILCAQIGESRHWHWGGCLISFFSFREYQSFLPSNGVELLKPQQGPDNLSRMCEEYIRSRTLCNWKFWIVSFRKRNRVALSRKVLLQPASMQRSFQMVGWRSCSASCVRFEDKVVCQGSHLKKIYLQL